MATRVNKGKDIADGVSQNLETDEESPAFINLTLTDNKGTIWGTVSADPKKFKSGAIGFYGNGKVRNPVNGKKYQIGCNITLVGSKPKEEKNEPD